MLLARSLGAEKPSASLSVLCLSPSRLTAYANAESQRGSGFYPDDVAFDTMKR